MPPHPCPTPQRISDFLFGRLPDKLAAKIAEHLHGCLYCESIAESLAHGNDPLVASAKDFSAVRQFRDDSELHEAIHAIGKIPFDSDLSSQPFIVRGYQLVRRIGQGGLGTVYLAVHLKLEKHVAIKLLKANRKDDPQSISRFAREMKAVGKLEHPNIVRAMDAGETEQLHFLVMEYIDGFDFGQLIRLLGRISVANACEITRQAAAGLHHAHQNSMVHRDVKPSNLMLTETGTVKLLDLGLAQMYFPFDEAGPLTHDGQLIGTLDYMAPEQLQDSRNVDARCDLFSLGVALLELLTGRQPSATSKRMSWMDELSRREDIPREIKQLVARMIAEDPQVRPSSAREVVDLVQPWCEHADLVALHDRAAQESGKTKTDAVIEIVESQPTPALQTPNPSPMRRQRTIPLLFATTVLALGLATIAILYPEFWKGAPADPELATIEIVADLPLPEVQQEDLAAVNRKTGERRTLVWGKNQVPPGSYSIETPTDTTLPIYSIELEAGEKWSLAL